MKRLHRTVAMFVAMVLGLGVSAVALAAPSVTVKPFELEATATPSLAPGTLVVTGTPSPPQPTSSRNETPQAKNGAQLPAEALSLEFDVSLDEVIALHESGLGFGEIVKLYALAKTTGKSVDELLAMREAGQGWGEIEKALGVAPGSVRPNLGETIQDVKPTLQPKGKPTAQPTLQNQVMPSSQDPDRQHGKGKGSK